MPAVRAGRMAVVPAATSRPGAMPAPKRISVLGATGSVGTSTLDLIGRTPHLFEVVALTAQSNVEALAECALRHRAALAVVADPSRYQALKERLSGSGIEVAAGAAALIEAAERPADCVMAGISGAAGLGPTMAAVMQGRRVALANKECLVSAGEIFMEAVREAGTELVPVDSEHSGAFQAIAGADPAAIERIVLTASGGPFRTWSLEELAHATPQQALCHPNWSMGRKITIDSATMMNKGLELIEAYHLFPVQPHQLEVVVHPQSIIHALVAYRDGSMLAQLASPGHAHPDRRQPGMAQPHGGADQAPRSGRDRAAELRAARRGVASRPLALARQAMQQGGMAPAVLNAANEVAVEAFLAGRLGFLQIAQLVAETLEMADGRGLLGEATDLTGVLATDASARRLALNLLGMMGTCELPPAR